MTVHSHATEVGVELENVGEDDLILNLGSTLANGRKQYPTEIVLILTNSQGKARRFDLKGPASTAGRVAQRFRKLNSDESSLVPEIPKIRRCKLL